MQLESLVSFKHLAAFWTLKVFDLGVTYWVFFEVAVCFEWFVTNFALVDCKLEVMLNVLSHFLFVRKNFSTIVLLEWSLSWSFARSWLLGSENKKKNLLIGLLWSSKIERKLTYSGPEQFPVWFPSRQWFGLPAALPADLLQPHFWFANSLPLLSAGRVWLPPLLWPVATTPDDHPNWGSRATQPTHLTILLLLQMTFAGFEFDKHNKNFSVFF